MSTRSKTRLASASVQKVPVPEPVQSDQKSKNRLGNANSVEKENITTKPKPLATKKKALRSSGPVYCLCQKGDDGSPMIQCDECKLWYHFTCVDLKEEDACEINKYICPACNKVSGRRTAMEWEGPAALEEVPETSPPPHKKQKTRRDSPMEDIPSESEESLSSADEYRGESPKVKGKRPIRRLSYVKSDSEDSDDPKQPRRSRIQKHLSPPPGSAQKRKTQSSETPPPKRKKPEGSRAIDDPTRKYCLGKLEELFQDVFLRYPHVRVVKGEADGDQDSSSKTELVKKKQQEGLADDEKAALVDESKRFAMDLEAAVFETYSELDKQGVPSAGSKYKDRFRMLQFNLSKPDRVVLHQRIASALITPKEISLMSSTDLANEETKESIKIAEKEALEHSILKPTTIPRAKITHKGLEDIEDVHGQNTAVQEDDRKEDEERRERERTARLRAQARQRTESMSVPPESPITPQQLAVWGAPPPVPLHAMIPEGTIATPVSATFPPSAELGFASPSADTQMQEPELNLADFINIEDDTPAVPEPPATPMSPPTIPAGMIASPSDMQESPPDGNSPLVASEESKPSFDLDALWSKPRAEDAAMVHPQLGHPASGVIQNQAKNAEDKDVPMESGTLITDDHDFDMFLDEKPEATTDAGQAALEALPQVWTGKINMPLDSMIPQETAVIARQIGGKSIQPTSDLWKTLFPSDLLRIDGRVAVDSSSKYLVQNRMNVAKELIAVSFSPATETNDAGFRVLSEVLIAKKRHGLVFPWGSRPKDFHPGKEMYIIPLLSSDPLPECIEVLDNLHVPKYRKADLLIGIWILTKGKLAPPPPPPAPLPAFSSVPPNLQSLISAMSQPPMAASAPPAHSVPINIASEVASLTPEQIQMMIKTLTGNGTLPLPLSMPQAPPPLPPQQPPPIQIPSTQPFMPYPPVGPPPQPWGNPAGSYPAPYSTQPLPNMNETGLPPPHRDPPHHQNYHDRPDRRESRFRDREERGSRGWRGRGRGRSGGSDSPRRPVDSGWPRRSRPDDAGNATGGPSSPTRRW